MGNKDASLRNRKDAMKALCSVPVRLNTLIELAGMQS